MELDPLLQIGECCFISFLHSPLRFAVQRARRTKGVSAWEKQRTKFAGKFFESTTCIESRALQHAEHENRRHKHKEMIHHIQIGAHLFIEGKRTNNHKKYCHAHSNLDQESNLDQHTKTLYKLGENAKGGDNVKHTIPVHQHCPPDGDSKSFHCLKSFCSCLGYTLKQTTYVSRGEGARGYQSPIISCPSTSLLLADWLEVVRAVLLLPRQCNSCSWRLWISSLSCWMFFSCTNITCK